MPLPSSPTSDERIDPSPALGGGRPQRGRRDSRRVCGTDSIDAGDLRHPLEHRHRARLEVRREAVEHAREAELGLDEDALRVELEQDVLLCRQRLSRPAAFLLVARDAARVLDALGERRRPHHDDHALAERDRGARGADEPLPARGRSRRRAALRGVAARGDDRGSDDRAGEQQRGGSEVTPPHAHRGRGRQTARAVRRTAPPRRSSPRCPCTARAARAWPPASEARSSEFAATPPTTAIRSCAELRPPPPACARRALGRSRAGSSPPGRRGGARARRRPGRARRRAAPSSRRRRRSRGRRAARPGSRTPPRSPSAASRSSAAPPG